MTAREARTRDTPILDFVNEVMKRAADADLVRLLSAPITDDAEVAQVLERLWGGDETLIVVSSDMSHYLPYESARAVDAHTGATLWRYFWKTRSESVMFYATCWRRVAGPDRAWGRGCTSRAS